MNALHDYAKSPRFNTTERVALEYADAMTDTSRDVGDALFARVREHYDEEQKAELTPIDCGVSSSPPMDDGSIRKVEPVPSQESLRRSCA